MYYYYIINYNYSRINNYKRLAQTCFILVQTRLYGQNSFQRLNLSLRYINRKLTIQVKRWPIEQFFYIRTNIVEVV